MITVTHLKPTKAEHKAKSLDSGAIYIQSIKDKITKDRQRSSQPFSHPLDDTNAIIFGDGVKTVLVRKPSDSEKCVIDWLNVTFDARQFYPKGDLSEKDAEKVVILAIGQRLKQIIGFGIDSENETGRNFYRRSFNLEHKSGVVCIGGQKDTVMVSINGTGCTYANYGWESLMFDWLNTLFGVYITRIDLAHDMLDNPNITIDTFNYLHSAGGFCRGGRNPDIEYRGNWKSPNGKGRTLYVGSRQSSKFCRIYEKGKQLGDFNSNWLRIEVEYKSRDIYIPLSVLLNQTDYFLATYPCFSIIEDSDFFTRFETREKNEQISFAQSIELVKKQYGRYLNFFRDCFCDDKLLLDILTDIPNKSVPEKLDPMTIPKDFTRADALNLKESK